MKEWNVEERVVGFFYAVSKLSGQTVEKAT